MKHLDKWQRLWIFFVIASFFSLMGVNPSLWAAEDVGLKEVKKRELHKWISKNEDKPFAFVILCHVRDEGQDKLWRRCYQSVREFYPNIPVVIIDDNSNYPVSGEALHNTFLIRSEFPGAGELLPYYYFLKHQFSKKMVFLHDSMVMKRRFTKEELDVRIKFHWHFDLCWDEDVVINDLLSHLKDGPSLIEYNKQKDGWLGCFGVASIIDLDLLKEVERKYKLTAKLKDVIQCRPQRSGLERVFAILMFREGYVTKENCSNFGNITSFYPHYFSSINDEVLEELKKNYPGAIIKTWHGR